MESNEIESFITNGQYDKAIDILNDQETNLDAAEKNYLLGYAYRLQGRTEESIRHYIKTIKNDFDGLLNGVQYKSKQYYEAKSGIHPRSVEALKNGARYWRTICKKEYAEPLIIIRLLDHLNPIF